MAVSKHNSQIDVLINNAAIGPTMASTVDTGADAFRRGLAVNLIGPFIMAREAALRMQPGAAIVNVASVAGLVSNPKRNAYAASKADLISLTKSLACEWACRGIRLTAVAPGCVHTPMLAKLEEAGKMDLAAMRRRVPMGWMARPDEIARAVPAHRRVLPDRCCRSTVAGCHSTSRGMRTPAVDGNAPEAELSRPAERTDARIVLVTGGANGTEGRKLQVTFPGRFGELMSRIH